MNYDPFPTIVLWLSLVFYIGIISFVVRCLITHRCAGIDEHAMIPGDDRLTKARDD